MSPTTLFPKLTASDAPEASRAILTGSERQFGFLPSPVARAAHSPVTLKHLLAGFAAFDQVSLSHAEREVIAMTVAVEVGCHYCVAMHSAMMSASPGMAPLVEPLRAGRALDVPRLEALRQWVLAAVRHRGAVPAPVTAALRDAGFDDAQSLEIVLGVGVYLMSTLLNTVTNAELDAPFAGFAWTSGAPAAPGVAA